MAPALLDVLKTLREKQLSQVNVKYVSHTLFEKLDLDKLPEDLKGKVIDPRLAFSDSSNRNRERHITESLEQAFRKLLGEGVVSIVADGQEPYAYGDEYGSEPKPPKSPITFVVNYEVALTGTIYESVKKAGTSNDDKKFLGIAFLWDLDVAFDGDEKPRYTFAFDSEPARDIKWTTYGNKYGINDESPTLPYDKMAESGFDDFQHQIAVRFGIEQATPKRFADDPSDEGYDDGYDEPPPPPTKRLAPLPKKR
jgi:hypothetical protein